MLPVEGMNAWPVSEKTLLKAPGYVKMPCRPKKERKREAMRNQNLERPQRLVQLFGVRNASKLVTIGPHVIEGMDSPRMLLRF
jgi:hypothetical protein